MKGSLETSNMAKDLPILGPLQDAVLSLCRKSYPKSPGFEVDAIICISILRSSLHHVVKIHEKISTDDDINQDSCDEDGNNSDFDSESCYVVTKQDSPVTITVTDRCPVVRITQPHPNNLSVDETNLYNSDEIHQNTVYREHGDAENEILSSKSNTQNFTVIKTEPVNFSTESCKLNCTGSQKTYEPNTNMNLVDACSQVDPLEVQDSGGSQNLNSQTVDITENVGNAVFSPYPVKCIDSEPKYPHKDDMYNSDLTDGKLIEGIVIKQEPLFETEMLDSPIDVISNQALELQDISNPENIYLEKTDQAASSENNYHHSNKKRKISGNYHFRDEHTRSVPSLSFRNKQICELPPHGTVYLANPNISGTDYSCAPNATHENFNCNTDSVVSQILKQEKTVVEDLTPEDISDEPLLDIMQSSSSSVLDSQWFNTYGTRATVQQPQKLSISHLQQISGHPHKSRPIHSISNIKSPRHEMADLKKHPPSLNFSSSFPFQTLPETAQNDHSDVTLNGSSQTMKLNINQKLDRTAWIQQSVFAKQPSKLSLATLFGKNLPFKEKKYFCKNCGAGFTELYNKMRHEKTTCGVMCYKCEICSHTFSRSDSMSRHMFHVHGVKKSPGFNGKMPVT